VAGEVDQVELAAILVEEDALADPETDEGSIRASHILYSPGDDPAAEPAEGEPPSEELRRWEEARLDAQAAADDLRSITDPAARAEAFAERARAESDDPTADVAGGDLGYFTRGTMVEEFATALFDDADLVAGDIVGPIRTQFGWHVISFTDRRAPIAERLAAVEEALAAPDADFAAVASDLSDGAEAPAGGETGWHTFDEVDEIDDEALQALSSIAVGDRTGPLETDEGFLILRKLDEGKRPLDPQQAARVRQRAFADWYQTQRFEAETDGRISQDISSLEL
jgi:parvulin-like peptidyl-prolyl isomerase